MTVAITGAPNVGKSSLFNALADRDAAIVSPLPGTTRDALEVSLELGGVAVTLVDTAGLRETDDPLEAEGIRRARARAASADLVVELTDARSARAESEPRANVMYVASKIDLATAPAPMLGVSVVTRSGLSELKSCLSEHVARLAGSGDFGLFARARHVAALRTVSDCLRAAVSASLPELRAEELRDARAALGRLAGRVDTEAVLDVVFGSLCIGK